MRKQHSLFWSIWVVLIFPYYCFSSVIITEMPYYSCHSVSSFPKSRSFINFPEYNSSVDGSGGDLPTPTQDFTVETYMFLPGMPPSSPLYIVLKEGLCVFSVTGRQVFNGSYNDHYFDFFFGVPTGVSGQFSGKTASYRDSRLNLSWHHVAVTYEQSTETIKIYMDGAEADLLSNADFIETSTVTMPLAPSIDLFIGGEDGFYLDEYRISNTIMYGDDFTPPDSPLSSDSNTARLFTLMTVRAAPHLSTVRPTVTI